VIYRKCEIRRKTRKHTEKKQRKNEKKVGKIKTEKEWKKEEK